MKQNEKLSFTIIVMKKSDLSALGITSTTLEVKNNKTGALIGIKCMMIGIIVWININK